MSGSGSWESVRRAASGRSAGSQRPKDQEPGRGEPNHEAPARETRGGLVGRQATRLPVRPPTPSELRASDADRERVAEVLSSALADGRLTVEEHAERLEHTYAARTLGDLTGLTTDLVPRQQQPIQVYANSPQVLFGSERRSGRWVVPERFPVMALCGTVELDLREALLQRRHVVIQASILAGRVKIIVPEGVRVEFTGRSLLGSRELRIRPGQSPDPPVIEVAGTVILGRVSARTPKRRWRDRLLRRA